MGIDFNSDRALRVGFVFRVLVDLTAQLVRAFAVHAPRLASPFGRDFAQALKKQHTARILGADVGNTAGSLAGGLLIHAAHMPPQLPAAVLAFYRLARDPVLLRGPFETPIAVLLVARICDTQRLD